MSSGQKLIKNTLIYTVGNFGSKILSFILIPIYSYFLSKKELGEYDLVLTTVNLLLPIVSLQMNEAIYRWLIENKTDSKHLFRQTILLLLLSFVVTEICIHILNQFYNIIYIRELSILLFTSCLLPFFQQILRGLGLTKYYSFIGITNSFFIFFFSILFLLTNIFDDKVKGIFYALFISNLLSIVFIIYKIKFVFNNFYKIRIDVKMQKSLLVYSIPLIFNSLSWWIINASDRFVILKYMSIEDNGIFAVSSRLPAILTLLNTVFMLAWQDLAISANDDNNPFYSKLFNKYISINLVIALLLVSASPVITYYLFDDKFYESWKYAMLLYVGSAFSSISGFLGAIYLKTKSTKGILITSIIGAIINIIISISLINVIGLYAPAFGSVCSFIVIFILRYSQIKSVFKLKINYKVLFFQLILLSIVILINIYLESKLISLIISLIAFIYMLIINRSIIVKLKNKLNIKI
ncbi:lipopolysaccharide biosynthesis protein [Empedobacter brevis]|uniref:lipopolysaccharide biosynthesis protein n=1 Tax=Empedobacter brevis TaxID=247 RepID=UPI0039B0E89D